MKKILLGMLALLPFCAACMADFAKVSVPDAQAVAPVEIKAAAFSPDEVAWLHVDGRHIKTADGKVFVGRGAAYIPSDTLYGNPEDIIGWFKKLNTNVIRVSMREEENHKDVDAYLAKYVDPIVKACRHYGIYCFLDQHNYFHEYAAGDSWLPRGAVWGPERVKVWAANWKKIAERYKDEPWVMGYELMNEPYDMPGKQVQQYYSEAIKAIREVDTKHIIILGTCDFTHANKIEETWGKVKLKPDQPYNQAVFAFHEYTRAFDPEDVSPWLDRVQKRYNVPLFCTEFGAGTTVAGTTEADWRKFLSDMFAMCGERQIGWTIWRPQGTFPNIKCEYEDLWQPAIKDNAPTLVVMKGQIECSASAAGVIADNKTQVSVTAVIKGLDGKVMESADNLIEFVVKGDAVLEGGNPVKPVKGAASVKVKFNKTGIINVLALSRGFYHGRVDITGKPDKPAKVVCMAEPAVKQADGSSVQKISAVITDTYGNTVPDSLVYRVNCGGAQYVDSKGQVWLGDQAYADGAWGYTAFSGLGSERADKISNTQDEKLFNSCAPLSNTAGYRFTLPNGKYRVEFRFAELWFGTSRRPEKTNGARVFDILINNETVITGLDIYTRAGGPLNAYSETCVVEVKNGELTIFANNKMDRCEVRAIEITPETPTDKKVAFSFNGSNTPSGGFSFEGANPADPVGGIASINLRYTALDASKKNTVSASFPGLASGTAEIK